MITKVLGQVNNLEIIHWKPLRRSPIIMNIQVLAISVLHSSLTFANYSFGTSDFVEHHAINSPNDLTYKSVSLVSYRIILNLNTHTW